MATQTVWQPGIMEFLVKSTGTWVHCPQLEGDLNPSPIVFPVAVEYVEQQDMFVLNMPGRWVNIHILPRATCFHLEWHENV
jgi:hypothetical protein